MKCISCAASIAAVLLSVSAPALAQTASLAPAAIDTVVQKALTAFRTPGATIAIVENGHVVYAKGYGLRDVKRGLAADADTHYEIGSMTKQFTAAAILQLRDAGKLKLDDPLATYLPKAPHAKEVTLRQLLTHTSGMPDYTDVPGFEQLAGHPGSYDRTIALIAGKPLDFTPGSKWEYSNTNYILLGRVIEVVSHEAYGAYAREHELVPAGMTQTATIADEARLPDMSRGYTLVKKNIVPAPALDAAWAWSAGYLVSTVGDFARWSQALSNGTIVPAKDYAEMITPAQTTGGKSTSYGFGLMSDTSEGQPRIWHNGGTFGFATDSATYPAQHLQIIVFTNLGSGPSDTLVDGIFDALHPEIAALSSMPAQGEDPAVTAYVKSFILPLLHGHLNRSMVTPEASKELSAAAVASVAAQFSPLGDPTAFIYKGTSVGHHGTIYEYLVRFPQQALKLTVEIEPKTNLFYAFFFGAP